MFDHWVALLMASVGSAVLARGVVVAIREMIGLRRSRLRRASLERVIRTMRTGFHMVDSDERGARLELRVDQEITSSTSVGDTPRRR